MKTVAVRVSAESCTAVDHVCVLDPIMPGMPSANTRQSRVGSTSHGGTVADPLKEASLGPKPTGQSANPDNALDAQPRFRVE